MKFTYTNDEAKEFLQNAIELFESQKTVKMFSMEGIDKTCKKLEKKLRRVSVFGISKSKKELANQRIDAYKAIYYLLKTYNYAADKEVDLKEVKRLVENFDIECYLSQINTFAPLKQQQTQEFSM